METLSTKFSIEKDKSKDLESNKSKQTPEKVSMFQTATHLFKGSVGAGIFAMGDCFKNGGLAGSTLLMPIMAVIVVHCERMLIDGSVLAVQKTPDAIFFDYPETAQKCFEYGPKPFQRFSKFMKLFVEVILSVTQFGFCAIFFVFIIKSLHQVLFQYGVHFSEFTVALITLLPALIPSLMTNLKLIAPVSLLASICIIFGIFSTLTIALTDGPLPSVEERNWITSIPKMALFFGTAQFAFEGIAVILPLRNSMKEPERFISRFGVLNVTIFVIALFFIFTGFVSYLRWGENVQGIITLNLDPHDGFSQTVKLIAASGVFLGYPLQFMILIKTIWAPISDSCDCVKKYPITLQVLFRFVMVLLTFGAALVVPKLGLFISLIGALCSTLLALIIPVIIDFVSKAQMPGGLNLYTYIKNIFLLIFAVFGMVICTYQSIIDIKASFNN